MEYFDAVYCICMKDRPVKKDFLLSQIGHFYPKLRPIVFDAINTRGIKGKGHHVGCAMSHRNVMLDAKEKKFKRIIVFEEDAILHRNFKNILSEAIIEIQDKQWDLFYLGAHCQRKIKENPFPKEESCERLLKPKGVTCTHGMCYNETFYDFVINEIPDNVEEALQWTLKNVAIDQWFRWFQNRDHPNKIYNNYAKRNSIAYIIEPIIATQHFMTTLYHSNAQEDIKDFLNLDIIKNKAKK